MLSILQVFGGLALFLFGVHVLGAGMEKVAGRRMKETLDRMTNRPIKGAIFGATATALIQSSSLVMVMMIGLINANLMSLKQAVGVMLGQGIGTTLTAQVVAFNTGDYSYLFIVLGLAVMDFVPNRTWRRFGEVILGFGVLFLGMQTMSGALKVVATRPVVQEWLALMGQSDLTAILAGTLATALLQSSSAVTGLTVAMGISQVITLPGAIGVLLGANIGTCVTGLVAAARLSNAARRAAVAQILINVIGVAAVAPFLAPFGDLVRSTSPSLPRQIANAHTIFNVCVSAVLFPFVGVIARLSTWLVPKSSKEERPKLTQYIDEGLYRYPALALTEAAREWNRIAEKTAEMVALSHQAVVEDDREAARQVMELEDTIVDPLCAALRAYLNDLLQENLSEEQQKRSFQLKNLITDVERVGDQADYLCQTMLDGATPRDMLDSDQMAELDRLFQQTEGTYSLALQAVRDGDVHLAELACQMEEEMDRQYWQARQAASERCESGTCDTEARAVFLRLLRSLERISDHADNFGISVMRAKSRIDRGAELI